MDKYDLIMNLLGKNLVPNGKDSNGELRLRKVTDEEAEKVRQAFKSMREDGVRGKHYLCEKCVHYVVFLPRATSSPGDEYSTECTCGLPVDPCTKPDCKICEMFE